MSHKGGNRRHRESMTQEDVGRVLRLLDMGASIDLVSTKMNISSKVIAEIKVSRELPSGGGLIDKMKHDKNKIARYLEGYSGLMEEFGRLWDD